MKTVTTSEMKDLERRADEAGLSYRAMMENAGQKAFSFIHENIPSTSFAVVFCGKGNNGGDGYVVARLLAQAGFPVHVFMVGSTPTTDDAYYNYTLAIDLNIPIDLCDVSNPSHLSCFQTADLIVDAIYGTGFHGTLPEPIANICRITNDSSAQKVSLDIPTGVSADTGFADEHAVRADVTIAFHALKNAHCTAEKHCGRVVIADIGIDDILKDPS